MIQYIISFFQRHQRIILCIILPVAVIGVYVGPMLLLGPGVNVTIHDHLDGAFVRLKVLAESGLMFAPLDATVPNIMNGLPRMSYESEFNVLLWLIYFFGAYPAYVLNQIIIRLIAFVGMYLLLRKHVLPRERNEIIMVGSALAFACLPFYPHFGLSVAGQPLVLYAFLNFRQNDAGWKDWLIIAFVPFYSMLFGLSNFFLLCAMGGLLAYDWLRRKKLNFSFTIAIAVMFCMSCIADYRVILSVLLPSVGFISHRTEFVYSVGASFVGAIKNIKDNFIFGQGHAASLHHIIVLPAVGAAAATLLFRRVRLPLFFPILGIIIVISFWYGIWPFCGSQIADLKLGLPNVNLSRFHYLHPMLWYMLFALALYTIWRYMRFGQIIVVVLLVSQICFLFYRSDHLVNKRIENPTYGEFFSPQLFSDIDKAIGKNKSTYRVVSIGIHPSIAQYNGFYTLDGLFYNYPLEYKKQFRHLIAGELGKSDYWRSYYDGWGSRVYIMVRDLQNYEASAFMLRKRLVRYLKTHIKQLSFDTALFKQMGGKYIFSALEIVNSQELGLSLVKIFDREDSIWEIYVYEAI